jgi:N-acyl amino acid synthase of PEP-CTERM/exosortase system
MFEYGRFKFMQADSENLKQNIFLLRHEVYALEFGFENPHDFPDKFEKVGYYQHSVHFAALNVDDDVIGTVRMILDSPRGFPVDHAATITGFPDKPESRFITEISRLAVSKKLRRWPEDGMHGVESYIPQSQGKVSDVKTEDQAFKKVARSRLLSLASIKRCITNARRWGSGQAYSLKLDG